MKTIAEFCREFRLSRRTYYRHLARGRMPKGVLIGKKVMIEQHAIDDWLRTVRGISKGMEESGPI